MIKIERYESSHVESTYSNNYLVCFVFCNVTLIVLNMPVEKWKKKKMVKSVPQEQRAKTSWYESFISNEI